MREQREPTAKEIEAGIAEWKRNYVLEREGYSIELMLPADISRISPKNKLPKFEGY